MTSVALVSAAGPILSALARLEVSTIAPVDLPGEPPAIAQFLASTGRDVVVFGPDVVTPTALAASNELRLAYPEVDVVVVAEPTHELVTEAMRNGVRQVVDPSSTGELAEVVAQLATAAARRRQRLSGDLAPGKTESGVITMMAAKGGVGKSTVAVNLAVELARQAANDVVLVDLDLMAGEVDILLGIEPKATIAAVASPGAMLDPTALKLSLTPHSSGLLVLPAPDSLIDADSVDCDLVLKMLHMLASSFTHVVVDTAPGAGSALAAAAEAADDLLVVATADAGGLRSLRRNLDGLDALGLTDARRHLLLNRADMRTGMSNEAIETMMDMAISFAIPQSREIPVAANQSLSFIEAYPKAPAIRAFKELAAKLASPGPKRQQPPRSLGAL
jgi:pilus assembly protein CpaE